jgi:hypothetical protein
MLFWTPNDSCGSEGNCKSEVKVAQNVDFSPQKNKAPIKEAKYNLLIQSGFE